MRRVRLGRATSLVRGCALRGGGCVGDRLARKWKAYDRVPLRDALHVMMNNYTYVFDQLADSYGYNLP